MRFGTLLLVVAVSGCGRRLPPPAPTPSYGEPEATDDRPSPTVETPPARRGQPRAEPARRPSRSEPVETDPILASDWHSHDEVEERIQWWLDMWQSRGRGSFERYLQRMGRYERFVADQIEEAGLPPSLRYLPVIEAGYNPSALSHAGAGGLWQFMPPTARWLGLEVGSMVDQRYDPYAATPIALGYITSLQRQFGSWWLTLAAYNSGPGRIERMIQRHAPDAERNDALYWRLRPHMPRETQEFVPKYLAAVRIARSPSAFGFGGVEIEPPWMFDVVDVEGAVSLDVLAEVVGADEAEVRHLNPQLVRGLTPAGVTTPVRVPLGFGEGFAERMASIPPEDRVTVTEHRVASGETLSHVAAQYRVSVAEIRSANPNIEPRRLQIGTRLVIPQSGARGSTATPSSSGSSGSQTAASSSGRRERTRGTPGRVHVVSSGESLWTIARRYDVRIAQIEEWNDLNRSSAIYPGDELRIQEPGSITYTIRAGDTIWDIARDRGLGADELLQYNGLSSSSVIRPGDEIQIPPQQDPDL